MEASIAADADRFYRERDSRGAIDHPLAELPRHRVAILVPPELHLTVGTELALFWTASIVRRMGRPFAELILVSDSSFRDGASCSAQSGSGTTCGQYISDELMSADPFAPLEWRTWSEPLDLADASSVLWLGTPPPQTPVRPTLALTAHGWVAVIRDRTATDFLLTPPHIDFDAATAAIVMAASLAAARVFSRAVGGEGEQPEQVAFALDGGVASCDPDTCAAWLASGTAVAPRLPWKAEIAPPPSLAKLLLVSAGGICWNVSQILRDSFLQIGSCIVVDPDALDVSNLNRLVRSGVGQVGTSKAKLAIDAIGRRCGQSAAVVDSYERWRRPETSADFRSTSAAVVVGVDQVRSRLAVGSDWPSILLNGATSGITFSAGLHLVSGGGCVGCWYGQDSATYLATRTPMACAAGAVQGQIELRPAASYPFVSVAAAAQLVALLVRAISNQAHWRDHAGTVISVSLRAPHFSQTRQLPLSNRCLLLCSAGYLRGVLPRET